MSFRKVKIKDITSIYFYMRSKNINSRGKKSIAKPSREPEEGKLKYQKNFRVTVWFPLSPYCISYDEQTRN